MGFIKWLLEILRQRERERERGFIRQSSSGFYADITPSKAHKSVYSSKVSVSRISLKQTVQWEGNDVIHILKLESERTTLEETKRPEQNSTDKYTLQTFLGALVQPEDCPGLDDTG
ncbi:hypothetical protein DNTS_015377, partial [Danionella cerebrum]